MDKVNLAKKLALFDGHRNPHVVADHDGHDAMAVGFAGASPFREHPDADDFFLLDGRVEIDLEKDGGPRTMTLGPDELLVVPAGLRHRPRAEAKVLLIERRYRPDTGDPATAAPKPRI